MAERREAIIKRDVRQVHLDPNQPSLHRSEGFPAFSITHLCASEEGPTWNLREKAGSPAWGKLTEEYSQHRGTGRPLAPG